MSAAERRGDVVLQVSQSAWRAYFQRQTFLDALAVTGVRYPTIVVSPDNWVYDAGTMRILLTKDPAYSGPGLLLVFVERLRGGRCRVSSATLLPNGDTVSESHSASQKGNGSEWVVDGSAGVVRAILPSRLRGLGLFKEALIALWRKMVAERC